MPAISMADPTAQVEAIEAKLEAAEGRERLRLLADMVAIYRRIAPQNALAHEAEIQKLLVDQQLTPQLEGRLLTDLSDSAYITGEIAKAVHWCYFALRAAQQAEYQWGRAQAQWRLARIHGTRLEFEPAQMILEEVRQIAEQLDSPELMSAYFSTLALVHDYQGYTLEFRKALYESLAWARRGANDFQLGLALLNMGFEYAEQRDNTAAMEYLNEALELFRDRGDIFYIAATLEVMAGVLHAQGKSGEALMMVNEAKRLGERLGHGEVMGRTLLQLAEIQYDRGETGGALQSLDRGLELWRASGNDAWLSAGLQRKGRYLLQLGRAEEALELLQQALDILEELGREEMLTSTLEIYAMALQEVGQHQRALATFRRHEELRAEQVQRGNQGRIEEMQARFESAEQDRAIADLELKQVLEQAKLERERGVSRLLVASAVLLAGIVLAAIFAYLTQRRGRLELLRAYGRLDTAHQALEAHSAEIKELVREKEELFALAADDLRVPVVHIRPITRDLKERLAGVPSTLEAMANAQASPEQREQLLRLVDLEIPEEIDCIREETERLEVLVDGLLKLYRLSRNEMQAVEVDVVALVDRVVDSMKLEIEDTGTVVRVARLPTVIADPGALETVFHHLLHNALQYLDPERPGVIEVSHERRRNETVFHVQDNGRGIARDDLERVFKVFTRLGSHDSFGEGIGLAAARTLVRRHGGFLWCDSTLGEGSVFSFSLPDEPRHAAITARPYVAP